MARVKAGVVLAIAFGILTGAGAATFTYGEGLSYLSNNPRACINCHVMRDQFDGWIKTSHHAVATCNDCHVPQGFVSKWMSKAENGFWHSAKFTLQDFHEPIRIRPHNAAALNRNCVKCHSALVEEIAHEGMDCVRCHAHVGHGPTR